MNAPAEILEKIKKLLRLARSSNPHEAALAMEKALALAAEHRVAVDQLDPDHQADRVTHRDHEDLLSKLPHEHQFAARILQRFFRVRCIIRGKWHSPATRWRPVKRQYLTVVGTTSDAEIALYVLGFLVHHFRFCWRKHRGRCRNRPSFMHGMFLGLYSKLSEAEPKAPEATVTNRALVVSFDAYVAQHIGKTEDVKMADPTAAAAVNAGWVQGRKTEILGGLKPSSSTLSLT